MILSIEKRHSILIKILSLRLNDNKEMKAYKAMDFHHKDGERKESGRKLLNSLKIVQIVNANCSELLVQTIGELKLRN